MLQKNRTAISFLTMAAVFIMGWSIATSYSALKAAAAVPRDQDLISAQRALDAMGDSGTAGIDAAEANAITAEAHAELTGDIEFSVSSRTFQGQLSVQMSTSVENAQIRYTTDGKTPTASSTLYSGALTLTATTQLRAQAFVGGTATGALGTAMYVARSVNATSELPLVVMDAYGGGKPNKTTTKDVSFMVMAPQNGTSSLSAVPAVATRAGFHLRGQSSASFAKAPYKIELRDNLNKDADYPVLNMPADSDWALLGPFPDKALIRDAFAWDVARAMGLNAPRYSFVEFYLNLDQTPLAAADYQGVYLLAETIKRGSDRVDVAKLKDTDTAEPAVTGGYIMQFNLMVRDGGVSLTCTGNPCWRDLQMVYPKQEDLKPAQRTWITNYIQKFHNALHSGNPSNAQTGYPAYIDVNSFVNRVIHNELAREGDSYMRSTHFHKDRGGKLVAGPVWDYDLGFNAVAMMGMPGMGGSGVQGWQYQMNMGGMPGAGDGASDWWTKLMQDPTFNNAVKARWKTLRAGPLSQANLTSRITTMTRVLANPAKRNFQKWPNLNTAMVGMFQTQVTQTWEQQVTMMRDFVVQRAAWLDSSQGWGNGSVVVPPGGTTQPPAGNRGCTASIAKAESWNDRFNSTVTVRAGNAGISNWTVVVRLTQPQTIQNSWNGTFTFTSPTLTVRANGNGTLNAGGTTTFGFTTMTNGNTNMPSIVSCTAS